MFLMVVPDEPEESAEDTATPSDSSQQPKAELDDSEATKASQKVELDLDDAPFLEDEDDEEELEEIEEAPLEEEPEEKPKRQLPAILKNKLFYMGLIIAVLLIIIAVLIFARKPAEQTAPLPETVEPKEKPEAVQPEPVVEETEPDAILLRLDPFLVEQLDEEGNIRFLQVRIVLSTTDQQMAQQFNQETYAVRNALYYYLKNKDLTFLTGKKYSEKLKKELLAVINQYIGVGQFETILFEQYFVR